jgi:hypothetical protein
MASRIPAHGFSGLPGQPGARQQGGEEVRKENRVTRGKVGGLLSGTRTARERLKAFMERGT